VEPHSALFSDEFSRNDRDFEEEEKLNSNELARDKFNALFAAHDAKDSSANAQQREPASKALKKAVPENSKPH
jgi:hypothetical protein